MIRAAEATRTEPLARRESGLLTCVNPREHVAQMSSSALFLGLSAQECAAIGSLARVKTYFRNETLFQQGEPVRKLVWIQTGRVKLSHVSPDGQEVLLWLKGPGQPVDLHADIPNSAHRCGARAMERCQALVWDYSSFCELAARHPQINANIAAMLAARLHELEERFCEIATHDVPARLALALLRLADTIGKRTRLGVELDLTRQELAELTGTTLYTVSRTLSLWAQAGMVAARRKGVVLRNPDRLRAFRDPGRRGLSLCRWPQDQSAQLDSYSASAREA